MLWLGSVATVTDPVGPVMSCSSLYCTGVMSWNSSTMMCLERILPQTALVCSFFSMARMAVGIRSSRSRVFCLLFSWV